MYSFFLVFRQRRFIVVYRLSVQLIGPIVRGQAVQEMVRIGCLETSVNIINQRCVKTQKNENVNLKLIYLLINALFWDVSVLV
jgi:hypothetical protein